MESEVEELRREVQELRKRCATLEAEKNEIEQRFEHEYKKWKRFKKWVLVGGTSMLTKVKTADTPQDTKSEISIASLHSPATESASKVKTATNPPSPTTKPHQTSKRCRNENKPQIPLEPYDLQSGNAASSSSKRPEKQENHPEPLSPSKTSLNSRYRLNPAQNAGLDFQFDEVVRHKHDRSKLGAEDCDCCREYYNVLAPLPLPAQPPLWRSPPTTPQKKRKYYAEESDEEATDKSLNRDVNSRIQKISRHRRRWEAPKTPPGYWDIGFPDTQQTEEINRRAREMHAQKLRDAEAEARIGGRYVRR
ncbi:DNA repair protein endonuclease SAE2/CtIP C-terminus-domain-containing protein [Irpex rosettiformis]|uniref:DNA repair protein endonuclease SAE2/CtIP C-terminus-domain-containing protein n=1 Tax=Irpex rosettiformis TaxID=378272 RepID=A0ACB8TRI8_9APHY|nr:DNA repair protein endonuclease SAE2/CtIP C-terminus-domain-containing protein [Irpex rosettiformis]